MARKSFVLMTVGTVVRTVWCIPMILFLCSVSSAVVPDKINYQGKLATAAGGGCLNDTVQMTFSIYPDTTGSPADWTETQTEVIVKEGIFNVLLGSVVSIPDTIFDGSTKYLGVQVESDPEMRPLKPMVSVAYAMKAGSGGNCHDCDTVFVNAIGPDSVVATTGIAFLSTVSGSETDAVYGIKGYAENTSSGSAFGVRGVAKNPSSGGAFGGSFSTAESGTGDHVGVSALAAGNSDEPTYGIRGSAYNHSSGEVYGGHFEATEQGTGYHCGVSAEASSDASQSAMGVYGSAENTSSGNAYGGSFQTVSSEGTGMHIGLRGSGYSGSSGLTFGVTGRAENTSTGTAYGGRFSVADTGTGVHYGLDVNSSGSSSSVTYGIKSFTDNNSSSGDVYGGYFDTYVLEGHGYGVYAESYSDAHVFNTATYGYASNHSNGDCWAGYFIADDEGIGTDSHTGVRGHGIGSSGQPNYGVWGYAENTSTGGARGGYFVASSSGTGTHYGVFGSEAAGGGGAAVYASGDFAGSGAKYAVVRTGRGHRLLSCMESPEVWFEDFGEGKLVNGKTHIELDPLFLETVTINADHPMKVFVQLKDDCKGTYVKASNTGFDVIELQGGISNASFSYRIVAKRKGYETERMRETDVGYDDLTLYPELQAEIDKKYQEEKQQQQLQREKRKQEHERMDEERKRMEEEPLHQE